MRGPHHGRQIHPSYHADGPPIRPWLIPDDACEQFYFAIDQDPCEMENLIDGLEDRGSKG